MANELALLAYISHFVNVSSVHLRRSVRTLANTMNARKVVDATSALIIICNHLGRLLLQFNAAHQNKF